MKLLVVAAHPDDEVLGVGAAMYRLAQEGHEINVCILSGAVQARQFRPSDQELEADISRSGDVLSVTRRFMGGFPNIELNTVPHLHLVQFIEKALLETGADTVITHHPGDTNNDHLHTSLACQAAIRLFQRRSDVPPIRELLYMEVLSATDWGVNSAMNPFRANTFVEVGEEGVRKKIEALSRYRGVMRPYPHPRSEEALMGLAACRGAQAGMVYAEAFESAFRRGL